MSLHDEAWHADRRTYIGGSDAPILTGDDPWTSEYDLWLEKTGQQTEQRAESDAMRYGSLVEDVVATIYEQERSAELGRPVKLRRVPRRRHRQYPFIGARLDRAVEGEQRVVQVKTAWKPWPSEDDIPRRVYVQVQHEMAVSGYPVADVALLSGFGKFTRYEVPRDDLLIAKLIRLEVAWWQRHIVQGIAPKVTGRHLNRLPEDGGAMTASEAQEQAAARRHQIDERLAQLGLVRNELDEWLKRSMAGSPRLEGAGWHISWKSSKPTTTVAWKQVAASYRAAIEKELALVEHQDMSETALPTRDELDAIESLYSKTAAEGNRPFRFEWQEEEH